MKEAILAATVVEYLRDLKWDVHQEVQAVAGIADIVAIQGPLVWIVECKTSLSLAVMNQGERWIRYGCANMVSVAVPSSTSRDRGFAGQLCRMLGLGVLTVEVGYVNAWERPRFWRPKQRMFMDQLKATLSEDTRTYAKAGSEAGAHFTAFKGTCRAIRDVLKDRPGLTTRELVDAVDHHYSSDASARSCLPRWLNQRVIEGVRGDAERPMRWYLDEEKSKAVA